MKARSLCCQFGCISFGLTVLQLAATSVWSAPAGATVTQGTATFTSQGSQLTIRTSDRAAISWQSFNIGLGETTSFVQPSASSVVWNQINGGSPSQILGNLNANGYVVLQNQAGFFIGGQAAITTHGLLMTTAPIRTPDLSGGGAWDFNAPPPSASIINYGQINVGHGGSAFLIGQELENHGTITAPEGQIGLYAGKEVLVSTRPDGRGLSAKVTLPTGSVDNTGKLVADAGTIALHAEVVNQGGLVQANSVREVNGQIQLVASDAVTLNAGSVITAQGGAQGVSPGGSVLVKSDNTFADQPGSTIRMGGGPNGGNAGQAEVSAPRMSTIQSCIDGTAAPGFLGGRLFLDPLNIVLAGSGSTAPTSGQIGVTDPPAAGTLTLDVTSFGKGLSQISLQAANNIEVSTLWTLIDPGVPATLSLSAGNNIILDDGSAIRAGNNWSLNLVAGTQLASGSHLTAGNEGIYLNGSSFLQTRNGNISLSAPNEVIVNSGAIRTVAGGSITVATDYGDVNSGVNLNGYTFGQTAAPYYKVNAANLGGISTAAGGDVKITAGGDVISYTPTQTDYNNNNSLYDAGTGAFGAQPGNVTISAKGNVFGHYVLGNGVGTITAGGNIGVPLLGAQGKGFALSLIKGNWNVFAPQGDIYVQDVRNPNGIFNDRQPAQTYPGYHRFDYDPNASVLFQAGDSVEITGAGVPHTAASAPATPIPLLFPPSLQVVAGAGGLVLDTSVILFPSPDGGLKIATQNGGNFSGVPDFNRVTPELRMSDSTSRQWTGLDSFGPKDHAATPPELNNANPVEITIAGNMQTVDVTTTKATHLTVLGDLVNSGFVGENLHPSDTTSIDVHGRIQNTPAYTFVHLDNAIPSADALKSSQWDSVFRLAVDPSVATIDARTLPDLKEYLSRHLLFASAPDFVYDAGTLRLGFRGPMPSSVLGALQHPLTVLVVDAQGNPIVDANGHLQTRQYTFAPSAQLASLYQESQAVPAEPPPGYQIGGPGRFEVSAASIDLGNTLGILSWGIGGPLEDRARYASLAHLPGAGAAIDVEVTGDLTMLTSTIASMYGGDVAVNSVSGGLNLGSQDLFGTSRYAFGIYTSGHSNVRVTADKDINIEGSRIAAYNGGNIVVESYHGDVNAGTGGNTYANVQLVSRDPVTGQAVNREYPIYGSGIVAVNLPKDYQTPGGNPLPGNITVSTPQGDIISSKAGIMQLALDGNVAGGPTVTLEAGTPASHGSPAIPGNVDLGDSGLIGGTVNVSAQGSIRGLIISRQNSTINAAQSFSGTLLSAGTANVSAGGSVSGTVIGIGGANVSGGGGISANVQSQNASVNGAASQSTLGTATATATSQAAAAQATSDSQQQVGSTKTQDDDDKKKPAKMPVLSRRVGRVTVILPPGS